MVKKTKWELVPNPESSPEPVTAPPVPGRYATDEEREVYEKWRLNQLIEAAKADETYRGRQIIKRLNKETTVDGVDTIEFYTDLKNEERDEDAQKMVEQYLKKRVQRDLEQQEKATDIGVNAIHEKLGTSLDPSPKPPQPKKRGLFG